jgi:hypothetical protein
MAVRHQSPIAAIQLGAPTAPGRRPNGYSSVLVIRDGFSSVSVICDGYSSVLVMEFAGEALAVSNMTAVETAPSECVMSEAHAAECEDRGDGCNFDAGSLHDDLLCVEINEGTCGAWCRSTPSIMWAWRSSFASSRSCSAFTKARSSAYMAASHAASCCGLECAQSVGCLLSVAEFVAGSRDVR